MFSNSHVKHSFTKYYCLQKGHTPSDIAKMENELICVDILQRAMVCYFNMIIEE